MSKSQAMALNGWVEEQAEEPLLILEKQLVDTLVLQWNVQRVRIRSNGSTTLETRTLFEGLAKELHTFTDAIRKRLDCCHNSRCIAEIDLQYYWRLFPADALDRREQFETLISAYVHYERQTSKALLGMRGSGDLESAQLLVAISKAVERSIGLLGTYLEDLALSSGNPRLSKWRA